MTFAGDDNCAKFQIVFVFAAYGAHRGVICCDVDHPNRNEGAMRKKDRINKAHSIADFVDKFSVQLDRFGLTVRETKNIGHRGAKGSERELSIRDFFGELLPDLYEAGTGEVVDLLDNRSPQLDVMIFDKSKNVPLLRGGSLVLPAEALLASVESKSILTNDEIQRACAAAASLKSLKPMKQSLANVTPTPHKNAQRYFHVVFAFATDLSVENWAKKELGRFLRDPTAGRYIDLVYVLGRGLINISEQKWMAEDPENSQALAAFYFAVYNFMNRENRRRDPAPYASYATDLNRQWKRI